MEVANLDGLVAVRELYRGMVGVVPLADLSAEPAGPDRHTSKPDPALAGSAPLPPLCRTPSSGRNQGFFPSIANHPYFPP